MKVAQNGSETTQDPLLKETELPLNPTVLSQVVPGDIYNLNLRLSLAAARTLLALASRSPKHGVKTPARALLHQCLGQVQIGGTHQ